jgi:hypothetical protein
VNRGGIFLRDSSKAVSLKLITPLTVNYPSRFRKTDTSAAHFIYAGITRLFPFITYHNFSLTSFIFYFFILVFFSHYFLSWLCSSLLSVGRFCLASCIVLMKHGRGVWPAYSVPVPR